MPNLGKRTNTVLQTCFFAISGILPKDEAIQKIKDAIVKSYSHKGEKVVQMNFNAVDKSLENLQLVEYPNTVSSTNNLLSAMTNAPEGFVNEVLEMILAGKGDELPVSAFPVDGTFPTGTTQYEKSGIADSIPIWDDENICTQCNKCVAICPHAAIRAKVVSKEELFESPLTLKHVTAKVVHSAKKTLMYCKYLPKIAPVVTFVLRFVQLKAKKSLASNPSTCIKN